jgi:aspartyl protease family protein
MSASARAMALGALAGLAVSLTVSNVQAQSVALAGMLGNKALLVVNGTAPKTVAAG